LKSDNIGLTMGEKLTQPLALFLPLTMAIDIFKIVVSQRRLYKVKQIDTGYLDIGDSHLGDIIMLNSRSHGVQLINIDIVCHSLIPPNLNTATSLDLSEPV